MNSYDATRFAAYEALATGMTLTYDDLLAIGEKHNATKATVNLIWGSFQAAGLV